MKIDFRDGNKKVVSTQKWSNLYKKSIYYKAARKAIKKKPKDANGYIRAMAKNYCNPPEPYVVKITNKIQSTKDELFWV